MLDVMLTTRRVHTSGQRTASRPLSNPRQPGGGRTLRCHGLSVPPFSVGWIGEVVARGGDGLKHHQEQRKHSANSAWGRLNSNQRPTDYESRIQRTSSDQGNCSDELHLKGRVRKQ